MSVTRPPPLESEQVQKDPRFNQNGNCTRSKTDEFETERFNQEERESHEGLAHELSRDLTVLACL